MVERRYKLEDIKFEGKGYKSPFSRKIRKSATGGLISVPSWLIGQEIDFILIPTSGKKECAVTEVKE
jgi:hypothetical protein